MRVTVGEYNSRVTDLMNRANDGEQIDVTKRGFEYVSTISTDRLRRLEHANAALQGFLRLAARGAEHWEYQERARDLVDLIRSGAVALPADTMEAAHPEHVSP